MSQAWIPIQRLSLKRTVKVTVKGQSQNSQDVSLDQQPMTMLGVEEIGLLIGTLSEDDWVLIKLLSVLRPSIFRYFSGKVMTIHENGRVKVKFVKRYRDEKNQFTFPEQVEDIADFDYGQIVGKIRPPVKLRRGVLRFNVNCDEW